MSCPCDTTPRSFSLSLFAARLPRSFGGTVRIWLIGAYILLSLGRARAEDPPLENPWIRHNGASHSRGVIVFVHGVLGNSKSSWSSSKSFWPELITRDRVFDGQDVYVYRYPSPLVGRTLSTDNVAENLRLVLSDDGVLSYNQLTIVSHSMGGLVTRAFLLKNRPVVPKIRFLYFFGTPTTGSPYAKLAAVVSKNRQFEQMYPMDTDSYVAPLQANWLSAHLGLKSYCAFETQTLFWQIIVERESATNLCTERLDPIDENHINMVKPLNNMSTAYRALKVAFAETEQGVVMSLLEYDTNRPGSDITKSSVADIDDCLKRCIANEQCKAISFHEGSKTCWLKGEVPQPGKLEGFTSAVKKDR